MEKPSTFADIVRDGLNSSLTEDTRRDTVQEAYPKEQNPDSPLLVKELRNRTVYYKRERKLTLGEIQAKKLRNNVGEDRHPLDEHWSAEYDIKVHLEYLLQLESSYKIASNFLEKHSEIDIKKRNTVIEWIKHMSSRFVSHEEIFHLTLSIFDRFLAFTEEECLLQDLQGYCFASFKIALHHVHTFNEDYNNSHIFCPHVHSWEHPYLLKIEKATEGGSKKADGVKFRRTILKTIDWNLQVPTDLTYLHEIVSWLGLTGLIRNQIMINVNHFLMNETVFSPQIIDQPPLAKVTALILIWIEFLQNQNEPSVNLADLQNVKKRLVQFAEDYGVIDPMRTLYQYFRAQMPHSGLVPNSS